MNDAFGLRDATAADAAQLAEFGARTFYESFAADNTAEDMRRHLESAFSPQIQLDEIHNPDLNTLIAVDRSGRWAGFAQLRAGKLPDGVPTQNSIELWRFYVDKVWHGQGVAAALMNGAKQRARRRGATTMWLGVWEHNARAQAFYRKHGFRPVGRQVFVVGSDPQTDDVLLCKLVSARVEHVAVWVRDLDAVSGFYARYFDARVGPLYENPRKGFQSRFLEIGAGARLEIMARSDVATRGQGESLGFAHVAIAVGDEAAVDALAARFVAEGVALVDGPRRTGDGYYECVVQDPEGNRVEVTAG